MNSLAQQFSSILIKEADDAVCCRDDSALAVMGKTAAHYGFCKQNAIIVSTTQFRTPKLINKLILNP